MSRMQNKWHWFHDHFTNSEIHLHGYTSMVCQRNSPFQVIEIIRSPLYGKMLILDGDVQSSETDEYIYHETLVHPALILHPLPQRILILGGGEGATLGEVLKHKTVEKATMFDLDPEVIQVCRHYLPEWSLNAFEDPRLELHFGNARQLLKESSESFDVIISDLTDPLQEGPSFLLFTKEFFEIVEEHLKPEGIFVLQASLLRNVTFKMHRAIRHTLATVFKRTFSYLAYIPSFDTTWGFVMATENHDPFSISPEEIDKRIEQRVSGELKFYDGLTHRHLFSLPKDIRDILSLPEETIEDANPVCLPRKGHE